MEARTIYGDSHDFSQDEAIRTDEGWNAIERVQLEIFGVSIGWLSLDKLDVEIIGFGDGKQNRGSRIAL